MQSEISQKEETKNDFARLWNTELKATEKQKLRDAVTGEVVSGHLRAWDRGGGGGVKCVEKTTDHVTQHTDDLL